MSKAQISKIITFLLTLTLYLGCRTQEATILKVEIQVPPGDYDSLSYHLSKESFTAYSISGFEREYFDSTGHATLYIETNRIGWFFMTLFPNKYDHEVKNKSRVFMLVRPGESYKIEYDSSYPLLFRIRGDFEDAQVLYNKFNHSDISSHPRMNWKSNTDSLSTDLLAHLDDSIHNSIIPFEDLYKEEKIDKEYFKTIRTQIQYSHADAFLDHLEIRHRVYNSPKFTKFYQEVTPLNLSLEDRIYIEEKIFKRYPPNHEDARILTDYSSYIDKYLKYTARMDFNRTFFEGSYAGKMENVNTASDLFDEEIVEYYFAKQFQSFSVKYGTDSIATYLFKEFKDRYPESRFMPSIIRLIEKSSGYYAAFYPGLDDRNRSNEEISTLKNPVFSPKVKFIQDQDTSNSINSLLSQFKGKNLFVDFWASWCGPCRYEFRFADSLHHFLQDHNIEMLYISSDENETQWYNIIQNYDLKGYHFRISNPELRKDLRTIVDFIPTYMIIDSTGRIVVSEAEKPHTKSKLYDQLIESLNLSQSE